MHNIRHFYYQNKEKIWKVVLIIAFLLGIIYFFNDNKIKEIGKVSNTPVNNEMQYTNEETKTYISESSAISGNPINKVEVEKINNTISKFLQHCKKGEVEQAYNMLSTDCRENRYKTLEKFKNEYVKLKFSNYDVYEIKNWIGDTYKISISKDLLATGDITDNTKQIEYITIVKEGTEEKLNINSYIGKKEINEELDTRDININVVNKYTYLDYEIYNFKIKNLTNNTIKLDAFDKIGTIYLKDLEGNKYNAYINEIFEADLEIKPKQETTLTIKYANNYASQSQIKSIIFENVILDYIKYKNQKAEKYEGIEKIEINI